VDITAGGDFLGLCN